MLMPSLYARRIALPVTSVLGPKTKSLVLQALYNLQRASHFASIATLVSTSQTKTRRHAFFALLATSALRLLHMLRPVVALPSSVRSPLQPPLQLQPVTTQFLQLKKEIQLGALKKFAKSAMLVLEALRYHVAQGSTVMSLVWFPVRPLLPVTSPTMIALASPRVPQEHTL